jgi:hypothetical protein
MKCYNHPDKDSIGICLSCGKAVCHDCARESEDGIACQQSCINSLSERKAFYSIQATHLKNLKRMNLLGSFFSIGMGILFMYFSSRGYGLVYDFIFILGVGFIVYGIVAQLVNMIIFFKNKKSKSIRHNSVHS